MSVRLKAYARRYGHGGVITAYGIFYLIMFHYLETRTVYGGYHVIHTVFDDYIPFCEFFIVPYLLWFPYMLITVLYFIFRNQNKREYWQLTLNLMMGMTIFLIVSYAYPNLLQLRPTEFARENIFTELVQMIYKSDTPTNVLPSIHVFNSLAIHMSLTHCEALRDNRRVKAASLVLTILIILSTMFLKQHSVIDVCLGATLALFGYLVFYPQKTSSRVGTVVYESNFRNNKHWK